MNKINSKEINKNVTQHNLKFATEEEKKDFFRLRSYCEENNLILIEKDFELTPKSLIQLRAYIKVYIYCRVSTEIQKNNYSLVQQVAKSLDYAYRNNLIKNNSEVLVVTDPAQMGDGLRPALELAKKLMKDEVGDAFIVTEQGRLSRGGNEDLVPLIEEINAEGVQYHEVEGVGKYDEDDDTHYVYMTTKAMMDKLQKKQMARKSRQGRDRKALDGKMPQARRIYGYLYNKETSLLEIEEKEFQALRDMYKWYVEENCSIHEVTRRLALYHQPPLANKEKYSKQTHKEAKWYPNTVSRMLENKHYLGIYYYGQTEIKQKGRGKDKVKLRIEKEKDDWIGIEIPQIFNQEEFDKIINKKKGEGKKHNINNGRPSDSYLLKGIAFCSLCGGNAGSGVMTRGYKYYACKKKRRKVYKANADSLGERTDTCNVKHNFRTDIVDERVWNYLINLIDNPKEIIELTNEEINSTDNLDGIEKEINDIKNKLEKNNKAIQKFSHQNAVLELISDEELIQFITPLKNENKILNQELEKKISMVNVMNVKETNVDEIEESLSQLKLMLSTYSAIDIKLKRQFINLFVERVELDFNNFELNIYTKFDYDEVVNFIKQNKGSDDVSQNHVHSYEKGNNEQRRSYTFHNIVSLPNNIAGNKNWLNKALQNKDSYIEQITRLHHVELKSLRQIAQDFDLNYKQLKQLMEMFDISALSKDEQETKKREMNFELIYNARYKNNMTYEQIKQQYNISPYTAKKILVERGIDPLNMDSGIQNYAKNNLSKTTEDQKIEIKKRYENGESSRALANEFGYKDEGSITKIVKELGGELRGNYTLTKEQEQNLIKDYQNGYGQYLLARRYGFSSAGNINKILKRNNIETRQPVTKYMEKVYNGEINCPTFSKYLKLLKKGMKLSINTLTKEEIQEMIFIEDINIGDICKLFSINKQEFYRIRKGMGLVKESNKTKEDSLKKLG